MVDPALRPLRLNTVELLRQPGTVREVGIDLPIGPLGVTDDRVTAEVQVRLTATSTIDGITVSGVVGVPHDDECRRCLAPVHLDGEVEVDEVYADGVVDGEAQELGGDALDLVDVVRDAVLLALADPPPVCRAECAGLCLVCGADRNIDPCGCDTTVRDERWSVLDELDLDED